MANKAVGPFVQRVFLAFESAARFFDQRKVRVVGTPVRQEFLTQCRPPGREHQRGGHHVLVFGGSQGAKAINSAAIEGLPDLLKQRPHMTVTHQTGEADHERVVEAYRQSRSHGHVSCRFCMTCQRPSTPADLVVARAGAMTVAELTACGKPAILIPLPTAIYDHQMKNAKVMEAAGAAVVLPQADLTGATLARSVAANSRRSSADEGDGRCECWLAAIRRGRSHRP